MTALTLVVSVLVGYLLGSIPVAYLVAKARGIDIFSVGTGNPGTANTFRAVGRGAGLLVFAADVLRGAAAVLIAAMLGVESAELWVLAGAAVVVGHWYPVFLRFRGGAGLASSAGVAVGVLPVAGAIGLAMALLVLVRFRSTGHAGGAGFAAFLLAGAAMGEAVAALAVVGLGAAVLLHARFVLGPSAVRGRGRD